MSELLHISSGSELILLLSLAFLAGFVDAIVGGGGLIQFPALLVFGPSLPIPTLMGSNKFAGFSGTVLAAVRYSRTIEIPWKSLIPAFAAALLSAWLGAHVVSSFPKDYIKPLIVVLLIAVALYTYFRKDFGLHQHPPISPFKTKLYGIITGLVLGFYDGFFGPGTGSFLIVIFVAVFGYNFLMASAAAKLLNCATNISALLYFALTNQIVYELAIPVAICNMGGAWLGTRTALKRGVGFVRVLFLIIVSAMILKLSYDFFCSQ